MGHVLSASSVWQERETFILYSWDEFALWKNLGAIGASLGLGGEQWQEPFHPGSHAPKFCVLPHHGTRLTVYRPVCPPLASELVSEPLRNSACVLITFINPPPSRGAGIWRLLNKYLPSESPTPLPCPHALPPFVPWAFLSFTIIHRD